METDPNAKAHPTVIKRISPNIVEVMEYQGGLTKREEFAKSALQGLLANRWSIELGNWNEADIAEKAVKYADALIKELNNG